MYATMSPGRTRQGRENWVCDDECGEQCEPDPFELKVGHASESLGNKVADALWEGGTGAMGELVTDTEPSAVKLSSSSGAPAHFQFLGTVTLGSTAGNQSLNTMANPAMPGSSFCLICANNSDYSAGAVTKPPKFGL